MAVETAIKNGSKLLCCNCKKKVYVEGGKKYHSSSSQLKRKGLMLGLRKSGEILDAIATFVLLKTLVCVRDILLKETLRKQVEDDF